MRSSAIGFGLLVLSLVTGCDGFTSMKGRVVGPDDKPVPEPGEAGRGEDEVHYYEVDETNVSGTDTPPADGEDRQRGDDADGAR